MPAWHPDFRNSTRLPDTKVVRTTFFVNIVAVTIMLVLVLYVIYNEYSLRDILGQIAISQRQIDSDKPGSERAVILFNKFQEEEKKLIELRDFQATKITGSDLLVNLGKSLPAHVVLSLVDYSSARIVLRGNIDGSSDEAIGCASAYAKALGQYPEFASLFDSITVTAINRDESANRINFEISLKFKVAPKILIK